MSRRRSTNVLALMSRALLEQHQGKIQTCSSGYSFGDQGHTTRSGIFLEPHTAADGRAMSLNGKRSATNCPKPPGDYPAHPQHPERHWVLMKDCRKCPHHIARRRGQPYPCCAVLVAIKKAGPSAVEEFLGVFKKAVDMAEKMAGGAL